MSCYIDGVYWETEGGTGANDNVDVYYDNWNHALLVSGKDNDLDNSIIIYISQNLDTTGLTDLSPNTNTRDIYWKNFYRYNLDTSGHFSNFLNITNFDGPNNCIEGEFQFKAISRDGTDTVIVDRGYFSDYFRTN